jgi:predicted  nucleic acid-binding Zn-ribbon protein
MLEHLSGEGIMRKKHIETITQKAEDLSTTADNLLNSLSRFEDASSQPFDLKKPIRGTDSSVSQIVARIHAVNGIIAEFDKATRADLVPLSVLNNLQQAIDDTISAIEGLIKQIDNLKTSHGGLQKFDYNNFHAQTKNGNNHNLENSFQNLQNTCELLLNRFFDGLYILKPRSSYSFQAAASALSSIINDANDKLSTLKKSLNQVSVSEESLSTKVEQATTYLDEIKRLKTDGDSDRKTIADYLAQATQEKTSIQSVSEEASKLQTAVKGYQERFDEFQQQLDAREATFTEGTEKIEALISSFEKQRSDVAALIERSEKMLSSATVAGLASNFSEMMEKLTAELRSARTEFFIGIAFLTLSAFPLLAFVIMPLAAPILQSMFPELTLAVSDYSPNPAENGLQYLGQVVARIAVLLPAAWFVSFTAIRHSSLFRLREHYAYKYSMAVAVEGFKQQAPRYEQEMAALVLEQLAFNPADKLIPSKDIREGKAPGIAGYLFERIRARTEPGSPPAKAE